MAFTAQDEDDPASSSALVALRSSAGRLSAPRTVPGAREVLGEAFDGAALDLLTGTAAPADACCSSVGVSSLAGGRFGSRRTLLRGLAGSTIGYLTPLRPAQLLAAIATGDGVWVAQSRPGGPFAQTREVSLAGQSPWTLATSALPGGAGTVAWTATTGQAGESAPGQVFAASGSSRAAPDGARAAVTVPAGHAIDELALVPGRARTTAAWVESWFDAGGAYHSQVVVRDLDAGAQPRAFAIAGQTASGVTAAGDVRGDQVVAWKSCAATPACELWAVVRRAGGRFGPPVALGPVDPYEDPAAAISAASEAVVGWIAGGRVLAAVWSGGRFGPAHVVSAGGDAGGLTVAFGPGGQALAAWAAGSAEPQLLGAVLGGA